MLGGEPKQELSKGTKKAVKEAFQVTGQLHYHGGCVDCYFRTTRINMTIEGIKYCSGCMYMCANWDLPDKGIHIDLPPGGHSAESVDQALGRTR